MAWETFPYSYTSPHIHSWIFKILQVIIFWVRVPCKMLNLNWKKIHSIILFVTCHGLRNFPPLIHIPSYPFVNFWQAMSYVVTSAVVATSVFLWSSELKLTKKLTRLVSTSNKRSSSGEMKKRPEEGDIYREILNFDTYGSKNWAVIINSHTFDRRFSDLWQWMWGVENFCNQVLTPGEHVN